MTDLTQDQLEREKSHITAGVDRYVKQQESLSKVNGGVDTVLCKSATELIAASLQQYYSHFVKYVKSMSNTASFDKDKVMLALNSADPVITCNIIARSLIQRLDATLTANATGVMDDFITYLNVHEFPKASKTLRTNLQDAYESLTSTRKGKLSSTNFKRKFLNERTEYLVKAYDHFKEENGYYLNLDDEVIGLRFDDETYVKLGTLLAMFGIENAYIKGELAFTKDIYKSTSKKTSYRISASPALLKFYQDSNTYFSMRMPVLQPMIMRPLDWTSPTDGGYLTIRQKVLKGVTNRRLKGMHEDGSLASIYEALNSLQSVRYQVNGFVADTMRKLYESSVLLSEFPTPRALAAIPDYEGFDGMDCQETFKVIREIKQAGERLSKPMRDWLTGYHVHKNEKLSQAKFNKTLQIKSSLEFCEEHKGIALYEVYTCDSRGRVYPAPAPVMTQGSDNVKSLLKYYDPVRVTADDIVHLKIFAANTWANNSIDKDTLENRVKWVDDNMEGIIQAGTDPMSDLWWTNADGGTTMWQFLGICEELANWYLSGQRTMLSYLRVGIDGSCNGLQHWSAILRNEEEGAQVNLIDSEKPSDIYKNISVACNELIAKLAQVKPDADDDGQKQGSAVFKYIHESTPGFNRKIAKRPAMTYAYNVSIRGIQQQFLTDCRDFVEPIATRINMSKDMVAAHLAGMTHTTLKEKISSAYQGMKFCERLAYGLVSAGLEPMWTTPDGFKVIQSYLKPETKRLSIPGLDMKKVVSIGYPEFCAKINGSRYGLAFFEIKHIKQYEELLKDGTPKAEDTVVKQMLQDSNTTVGVERMRDLRRLLKEQYSKTFNKARLTKAEMELNFNLSTTVADRAANCRAIGPNFIHSMDACHLRLTLKRLVNQGVTSFSFVHDEYAVPLNSVGFLHKALREEFVKMYEGRNVLKEFKDIVESQGVVVDAELPEIGNLDINEVLKSKYFFI